MQNIHANLSSRQDSKRKFPDRILLKTSDSSVFIDTEDIIWIGCSGNYLQVNLKQNNYLVRATLKKIEKKLNPLIFVRIHRSHIVNVNKISKINPWFSGDAEVKLKNGETLKLSRNFKENLEKFKLS